MYTLPPNTVAGSIIFSPQHLGIPQYLDVSRDIVISFDYACYGPTVSGSEGFCVFFGDTFNPAIYGGGPGPGLAYSSVYSVDPSQVTPTVPGLSGLTCGVLGVGFDITGNFGCSAYSSSGYIDRVQNSIALRSSYNSDFNIITRTLNLNDTSFTKNINLYQQVTGSDVPVFKRVRVRLTDFGQRIVVDMKLLDDLYFTNYLDYNFANYNNSLLSSTVTVFGIPLSTIPVAFPSTVRCGLGFSTGQDTTTTFKIKNFNTNGSFTTAYASGTYMYDVDTTTLSAIRTYLDTAAPYFYQGDRFNIFNYDPDTTNPIVTGGNPLIVAGTNGVDIGAPYVPGDNYVVITEHY